MDLTNQLHEVELNHVQANAVVAAAVLNSSSPPFQESTSNEEAQATTNATQVLLPSKQDESLTAPVNGSQTSGGPMSLSAIVSACTAAKKFKTVNNNSGMSFDAGKFIFREFVEVGVQTNPKGPQSGAEIIPSM